uniref:NB-ARC domain-containing protein n=1 Tax=Aegilops tauschii subsp. strangulata TaxID=200361 RepID=A0A453GSF4_AEGTS
DADERRERFNISPRETSTHDHSQATSTSVGHLMAQLPIQLHVDNLIRLLALDHDDNVIEKKLKVVTIFGPASADKTAVVRTYYHQYGGKFQYRAFLRVSRDPDMWRLLTDMISQIKAPLTHTISDVQGLTGRITKHLTRHKFWLSRTSEEEEKCPLLSVPPRLKTSREIRSSTKAAALLRAPAKGRRAWPRNPRRHKGLEKRRRRGGAGLCLAPPRREIIFLPRGSGDRETR